MTMKGDVEIYGGFVGNESGLGQRGDPALYPTILDGENLSYHTVTGISNARIDGFTVTGGNANGAGAEHQGGGMYNGWNTLNVVIANCIFENNIAVESPFSGAGGGIFNQAWSTPVISNCSFYGNISVVGGGVYNNFADSTIVDCEFVANSVYQGGGGMRNYGALPSITNCIFTGNFAFRGGGLENDQNSIPIIDNCTFNGNVAVLGGAISNTNTSNPTVTNSILWGNTPLNGEIYTFSATPVVTYSNIQGGYSGTGNIDFDPLFVTGPFGDYYLSQTAAGQVSDSPSVDAGIGTAASLGLDNRTTRTDGVVDSGTVDMGYHYLP